MADLITVGDRISTARLELQKAARDLEKFRPLPHGEVSVKARQALEDAWTILLRAINEIRGD